MTNTWDADMRAFVGLWEYPHPDTNADRINGPGEGESVRIVCQVRTGRLVTDTPFRDRQTSSRVWDRLLDTYFISDIYTDLPKVTGSRPPPGIPAC